MKHIHKNTSFQIQTTQVYIPKTVQKHIFIHEKKKKKLFCIKRHDTSGTTRASTYDHRSAVRSFRSRASI